MATAVEASGPAAVPPGPLAAAAALAAPAPAGTVDQASSAEQEAAGAVEPPSMMRTWSSSQRPPPSPFEGVPLHSGLPPRPPPVRSSGAEIEGPSGAEAEAEAEGGANGNRRSPRGLQPTKSAMKIQAVEPTPGAAPPPADVQQSKGLSWADTHGKAIHHVQEYQPSEHGSEGNKRHSACGCCVQ